MEISDLQCRSFLYYSFFCLCVSHGFLLLGRTSRRKQAYSYNLCNCCVDTRIGKILNFSLLQQNHIS